MADEKDLESDEALWALYERFNQERDRDEMARRFDEFKRVVLLVHQENNSDLPHELAINQFADGKLSELYFGGYNAFKQVEFAAKLPKTGVSYIWLDGKHYMEVSEELPKTGRFVWLNGKYYMELPEESQPE